ncbi:MAG: DUF1549 and DUF1553 domain-containing protein [Candidatus Poribacteria bacterium]|nr:DUF1549 and DUF1553 domain-containing protein [Candidatus Poribacteria bacterium]
MKPLPWIVLSISICFSLVLFTFSAAVEGRITSSTKQVDRLIDAKLKEQGIQSSKPSSDVEFLRRVHLDLTGKIPTVEEVVDFLQDGSKNKREKEIDELIGDELYLDYWTRLWTNWLIGRDDTDPERRMALQRWVYGSLARNMRYDQFVTALVAAEGNTEENAAGNYLLHYDLSPVDLTAHISRLFLGLPLQCAQCHDHKTEAWYQEDFYALAAFFANIRHQPVYAEDERGDDQIVGYILRDVPEGEISIPGTHESSMPRFLDGKLCNAPPTKRRLALSDWITSQDNPYFSHTIVNRVWAHFMGRGFVEPLDGFGEAHPPSHPELLDGLAKDFVIHGYDLRYLMRTILNTRAYQRTSETNKDNRDDEIYYSYAYIKPLSAEQFFYSMLEATGFERLQKRRDRDQLEAMKRNYLERFIFLIKNGEMEEIEAFQGTVRRSTSCVAIFSARSNKLNDIIAAPGVSCV